MPSPRKSAQEIEANKESANRKRKLRRLWSFSDLTFDEVCDEMGMTEPELLAYARTLGLKDRVEPPVYMPTHEQIRMAAAKIRAGWTEAERESRLGAGAFVRMNMATEPHNYAGGTTSSPVRQGRSPDPHD